MNLRRPHLHVEGILTYLILNGLIWVSTQPPQYSDMKLIQRDSYLPAVVLDFYVPPKKAFYLCIFKYFQNYVIFLHSFTPKLGI